MLCLFNKFLLRQHVSTNLGPLQALYHDRNEKFTVAFHVLNNGDLNFIFDTAHIAYHFRYN